MSLTWGDVYFPRALLHIPHALHTHMPPLSAVLTFLIPKQNWDLALLSILASSSPYPHLSLGLDGCQGPPSTSWLLPALSTWNNLKNLLFLLLKIPQKLPTWKIVSTPVHGSQTLPEPALTPLASSPAPWALHLLTTLHPNSSLPQGLCTCRPSAWNASPDFELIGFSLYLAGLTHTSPQRGFP